MLAGNRRVLTQWQKYSWGKGKKETIRFFGQNFHEFVFQFVWSLLCDNQKTGKYTVTPTFMSHKQTYLTIVNFLLMEFLFLLSSNSFLIEWAPEKAHATPQRQSNASGRENRMSWVFCRHQTTFCSQFFSRLFLGFILPTMFAVIWVKIILHSIYILAILFLAALSLRHFHTQRQYF